MNQWHVDFIAGSLSGICGVIIGHPLDTIKCRMQYQANYYKSTLTTVKLMLKEEQIFSLFKGFVPPMLNTFPINAM
jgi:hypothetical protein